MASVTQERAMLHEHGTKPFVLKPGSIVGAAKADLRNRDRKKAGELDLAAPYAFHRDDVAKAETPKDLLRLAIEHQSRGVASGKLTTRRIYEDAQLLKAALEASAEEA